MIEKISRYLKILDVELEDLVADTDQRMETQKTRLERGELAEYVTRENLALLGSERRALVCFLKELRQFDPVSFRDVGELEAAIEKRFTAFLEEYGFPHAVENFVTRKMRKVLQFCQCD